MSPPGYVTLRLGRAATIHVRDGLQDIVRRALSTSATLHAWAATHEGVERLGGRGEARAVPAPAAGPDGRDRWVVRHYVRGGAVARWLGDRYVAVGLSRPLAELRASVEARRRGVPTPAVLAAAVYPAGLFYRSDLVTEMVPGAADLAALLFGRTRSSLRGAHDRERLLGAAGALVAAAASAGLEHPDVNATNIVFEAGGEGRAHLLDLDRCRLLPAGRGGDERRMLERLERSLDKIAGRAGAALGDGERAALRQGATREGAPGDG